MTESQVYAGAVVLGTIAGMRSMSAPAVVSRLAHSGLLPVTNKTLAVLAGSRCSQITLLVAAGEVIADKLPFVPARTELGPLITRALSGAMAGAAITSAARRSVSSEGKHSVSLGALVGTCAAICSTYAAFHLRRSAGRATGIPDPVFAVVEDSLVLASAWLLFYSLRTSKDRA